MQAPIGILHEHPLWFEPLFAELERREIEYEKLHAGELVFDPGERESRFSVVLNRMSPSAWTSGQARAIFHSLHFLAYLDEIGADMVNRHAAFQVEISKARQCALFAPRRSLPSRAQLRPPDPSAVARAAPSRISCRGPSCLEALVGVTTPCEREFPQYEDSPGGNAEIGVARVDDPLRRIGSLPHAPGG